MKQGDDVFFFTLIDFLLQVFFFGLLIYVVAQAFAGKPLTKEEAAARQMLLEGTKVSSLVELTDLLTKMGPLEHLPGTSEFFQKNGGRESVTKAVEAVKSSGGTENVRRMKADIESRDQELEGLKGEMKAWGTPSCVYETVGGKVRPKTIARVRVFDDRIELENPSLEMDSILKGLNREFASVEKLSHANFRETFMPLVAQKPNCRYFLEVIARPSLLSSMNVVWSAFRT
ncbi:hypothetical protein [Caenimonas sp. SL110]|uniref:hypothetical protein n=1 Tax=Caenimonas sp. SL110 TaxID=1450524 RepID=UPI00065420A3|nr:hypothetical protein [Caenimonas sp. SL110]